MRMTILVPALALGVLGCDFGQQPSTSVEPLSASFQLTETSGLEATTFRSGENFDVSFAMTNTTCKRLTFYRGNSSPDVTFRIFQGDSVVTTSIDGFVFQPVVTTGYVEPGQTLRGYWRAPNTTARNPRIFLTPGLYEIQVSFPSFYEVEVKPVSPITISIIQ